MRNCSECIYNNGSSSWPGNRLPCGQFHCWEEITPYEDEDDEYEDEYEYEDEIDREKALELAEKIKELPECEWKPDSDLLAEFCEMANLAYEWEETDGDLQVVYTASAILGVRI